MSVMMNRTESVVHPPTRALRFARWMARPQGRLLRIAAGTVVAFLAARARGRTRVALGIASAVPFLAGAGNVCVLAPLLGVPFRGHDVLP